VVKQVNRIVLVQIAVAFASIGNPAVRRWQGISPELKKRMQGKSCFNF
jgi:hypothetical protein